MLKLRKFFCLFLALTLCVSLCAPIAADDDILFVAVNDTIPLTLSALPYESSGGIYVPYTVFDASPGGVIPAYNAAAQTFVLFTRQRRLVFDLSAGTVTDQDQNVKNASTTFRNGILYIPLVYCASHFGLKVSMLKSESGYTILRFTTGSEVYDDTLFVEKAESLIQYRIDQMNSGATTEQPSTPGQTTPSRPADQPGPDIPEQAPATVYPAFTGVSFMEQNAALLAQYNLRGTFFLTAEEITAEPDLVRTLYAAGHTIGLTVPEDCTDVPAALSAANDALDAVLHVKSLFALLPVWQQAGVDSYRVLTRPQEPVSAESAAQQSGTSQLLLISEDASAALAALRAAGSTIAHLRETTRF